MEEKEYILVEAESNEKTITPAEGKAAVSEIETAKAVKILLGEEK